jgi:hypothetical protein
MASQAIKVFGTTYPEVRQALCCDRLMGMVPQKTHRADFAAAQILYENGASSAPRKLLRRRARQESDK